MCGIVGYIGSREVSSVLVDGLKRLEYRGYDSCGVAIFDEDIPRLIRTVGRIGRLEDKITESPPMQGGHKIKFGIGHTRWATHGRPSEDNSHPHRDCTGRFFVAHNGIIENYLALKQRLIATGHRFSSGTDTEVLPHLIESYYEGDLEAAVRRALRDVEGVYGIVAVSTVDGQKIVAARNGPPLVVGLGAGENFVASDIPALLPYTRDMLFLKDGEVAVIDRDRVAIRNLDGRTTSRHPEQITWTAEMAEKEGYAHFMLKEIHEQARAIRDTMRGRLDSSNIVQLEGELEDCTALKTAGRIHIVAMGTSLHAALVGRFLIESLARIPVEVDNAAEFRYRDPLVGRKDVVIGISQSGETADTLAALKEAKDKGAFLLSICNVVASQAARQSDAVIYTHAGPEIGVASTKAFTTQLVALYLLALQLAKVRCVLSESELARHGAWLRDAASHVEKLLGQEHAIAELARKFAGYRNFLYLGRGIQYPIAMEGALKLKEISYIHAEGYTAGEMKHGPIALIDAEMPVVVLAPKDNVYRKTMGNIEEVKVRDGIVIAVATEGDTEISEKADYVIYTPAADALINPILTTIPLQLFSYHVALLRGCDVDKPRNLAKSVTVE
ncbi:MAG: glutamine--fructose-6-phosphate transaminase (isomerizing) [Acidobacteria bacterium]|nr:glutamine--fructose-6-phosphate transaminase (isomerizing) [Acidobacteriota bacterium]